MRCRGWRLPILVMLASGVLLLHVASAGAIQRIGAPRAPRAKLPSTTDLIRGGFGDGLYPYDGCLPLGDHPFNPVTPGTRYPTGNPTTGFECLTNQYFWVGTFRATPVGGGAELRLYCIDIRTATQEGFGYGLGTWGAANVPNVGYVARLLHNYFPHNPDAPAGVSPAPATLTNAEKAAVVQMAIWFFSDGFVASPTGNLAYLRPTVAAIVDKTIEQGPLPESLVGPSLRIIPQNDSGPVGTAVGPFKIETNQLTGAEVRAIGGDMFSSPTGTMPLPNPTTLHNGDEIWVRSANGSSSAVLQAKAEATVPTGNVYLYDGLSAPEFAQKLILARDATLITHVHATAEFRSPGSLVVRKRIAGPAAGSQGRIVISVACSDGVTRTPFVIRAGAGAGTRSRTYADIPFRTQCVVTETSNGSTTATTVDLRGDGQEVTIPAGETETVKLTDTYGFAPPTPGSLLVTKTIAGPSAGQQGPVTIHVVCNGTALSPDFVIAARTPAGTVSHSFEGILADSVCTVTETADGATDRVIVTVAGNDQSVTIPAGKGASVSLMDVYDDGDSARDPGPIQDGHPPALDRSGFLTVTKTITGPAGHQHGGIDILVACGGNNDFTFIIPARTGPGSFTRHFDNIPSGVRCTVTETQNGATSTVAVVASGSGKTVTIPATGGATVHLTDRFMHRAKPPSVTG